MEKNTFALSISLSGDDRIFETAVDSLYTA